MLARIGFRYVDRIDPFDGGPHYEAKLAEITLVRAHRRLEAGGGAARGRERRDPEVLAGRGARGRAGPLPGRADAARACPADGVRRPA